MYLQKYYIKMVILNAASQKNFFALVNFMHAIIIVFLIFIAYYGYCLHNKNNKYSPTWYSIKSLFYLFKALSILEFFSSCLILSHLLTRGLDNVGIYIYFWLECNLPSSVKWKWQAASTDWLKNENKKNP